MILFAKSGIRPVLYCAAFVSLAASTALADNPAPAHDGQGTQKHAAKSINGYVPRNRINAHPRNLNRQFETYQRDGKNVRVIDVRDSGLLAPRVSSKPNRRLAFRKQPTGGVSLDNSFDRLVLRRLRRGIDASDFRDARRRTLSDRARFNGRGDLIDEAFGVEEIYNVPIHPREGLLTEVANDGPLRPRAKIIQVSDDQKIIGEQRAAGRAGRFNRENGNKYVRFYRDNEAYDVRFPSIVYLNSP
ncbi:MAG: hypothetical protein ACR2PF_01375 [Rhizobiaceae bacterium]